MEIETVGGQQAGSPAPAESISGIEASRGVAYEADRDFRLLSPEGVAYGVLVFLVGLAMCWWEFLRGIGGNIIAAGLLLLLANLFDKVRKQPRVVQAVDQVLQSYVRIRSKPERKARQ
jgi:hypothetical protein